MKRIIASLLVILSVLTTSSVLADDFSVPAKNAYAVDVETGKILYEKNSLSSVPVGPTSKLLTAYIIYKEIEKGHIKWSDKVTISDYPYEFTLLEVSNVPLEKREYSVRELFTAMLVTSANSATIALAEHVAGSEHQFVDMMNQQLKDWGFDSARMVNATGLSNTYLDKEHLYPGTSPDDENTMSAKALATVAYRLLTDYPEVTKITTLTEAKFDGTPIYTYNLMLPKMPYFRGGINGLATGMTEQAGASFVASGQTNGMQVITVILNADGGQEDANARFTATNELLNYIAKNYYPITVLKKGKSLDKAKASLLDGKKETVKLISKKALTVIKSSADTSDPKIDYVPPTDTIYAPISKGQILGQFTYQDEHIVGEGYLSSPPAVDAIATTAIEKSFFLKVWWNHFVTYVNENL